MPSLQQEVHSCPVCDESTRPLPDYSPARLRQCVVCEYAFQELDVDYGQQYFDRYDSAADSEQRAHEAGVRLRWIQTITAPGRLLELGCAEGHFLAAAGRTGYQPVGVEISDDAAAVEPLNIRIGTLDDAELPAGSFDVACAWHVIEHVPEAPATLAQLNGLLRPGGRLLLEVPNLASARSRSELGRWRNLDPQWHVSHFTPRSLREALRRAGFADIQTTTVSPFTYHAPGSWRTPRGAARRARYIFQVRRPTNVASRDRHDFLRAVAVRP